MMLRVFGRPTWGASHHRIGHLEGFAAYRKRRLADARRTLDASLEAIPNDGPSMTLLERVESLKASHLSRLGRVVAHRKIVAEAILCRTYQQH
jgi:hypothetical protein